MAPQGKARIGLVVATTAALLSSNAWAHPAIGPITGFGHGFIHPLTGIDHILAMFAVGLFAATLGGRALWAVPLSFMVLMAIGGALGVAGIALPFVETVIALSVVTLGFAIAVHRRWPVAAAMGLVGVFAVFHGHAHGAEMPPTLSAAQYALGFMLATGVLHFAGIAVAFASARLSATYARPAIRAGGVAIAVAGAALVFGVF